jgi:hypothetical protein
MGGSDQVSQMNNERASGVFFKEKRLFQDYIHQLIDDS